MSGDDAAVFDLVNAVLRGDVPPPPAPSEYEFAKTIRLPAGRRRGRLYDPDSDACQRHLLQVISSRRYRRVVVCAPPQVGGKTTSAILPATLRAIIPAREMVGYGLPTLEALDKAWTEKLQPSIQNSGYGDHLPTKGAGSKGGRAPVIQFCDPVTGAREGGIVFMAGGAYGSTASLIIVDDVDQFTIKGKPDREAVEDILHRADSYGEESLRIVVGTIEFDEGSVILALIDDSTGTHPWAACPHCGAHQPLLWSNVVADYASDQTAFESARYRCGACAVLWTEDDRQRAIEWQRVLFCDRGQRVEAGKVVGDPSASRSFGLIWPALASRQADMREICVEYRAAKAAETRGEYALMRKFYRYRLCLPYPGDREATRADLVEGRLVERANESTYRRGEVPDVCDLVTVGVDVQLRRHYWIVVAFDPADEWYVLDWGRDAICGDMEHPALEQREDGLDRIDAMVRGGFHRGQRVLLPRAVCDTNFRPEQLRPWISRSNGRWMSGKGAGEEQVSRMVRAPLGKREAYEEGIYDLRLQDESPDGSQLFVAADDILDRIAGDWISKRGHLPADIDRELLQHLTGMKPGTKKRWEPRGSRHDLLDALVYAIAFGRYRRQHDPDPEPVLPKPERRDDGWDSAAREW